MLKLPAAGWIPTLQLVRKPEAPKPESVKPDFEKGNWIPSFTKMPHLEGAELFRTMPIENIVIGLMTGAWPNHPAGAELQDQSVANPVVLGVGPDMTVATRVSWKSDGTLVYEQIPAEELYAKPAAPWQPKKGEKVLVSTTPPDQDKTNPPVEEYFVEMRRDGQFGCTLTPSSPHVSYWEFCRPLPNPGWIPWAGGKCPVPLGTITKIRSDTGWESGYSDHTGQLWDINWEHGSDAPNTRIVAYALQSEDLSD